jgi:hypothetical protein
MPKNEEQECADLIITISKTIEKFNISLRGDSSYDLHVTLSALSHLIAFFGLHGGIDEKELLKGLSECIRDRKERGIC